MPVFCFTFSSIARPISLRKTTTAKMCGVLPAGCAAWLAVAALSGPASLSDQSHARALISISGAKARTMLAKLSSIDLHTGAFPVGAAAATSMDHTSVTLWRGGDRPDGQAVFNLLVFATFAGSLWHTMLDAAAEYRVTIAHSEELA